MLQLVGIWYLVGICHYGKIFRSGYLLRNRGFQMQQWQYKLDIWYHISGWVLLPTVQVSPAVWDTKGFYKYFPTSGWRYALKIHLPNMKTL